jgi:hypothetical protein
MSAELVSFAKGVARGGTLVTRSGIYRILSTEASHRRADGQSPQQSFVKLISTDPVARELFSIHQALGRRALTAVDPGGQFGQEITKGLRKVMHQPDSEPDGSAYPAPAGDDEASTSAQPSLDDLVRVRMKAKPGMSKSHAMVDVLDTAIGKRAYQRERDVRLRKALGGG